MQKILALSIIAVMLPLLAASSGQVQADQLREPYRCLYPEARCLQHRCPNGLCPAAVPDAPRPPTVADNQYDRRSETLLSLDEAICMALQNAEVIRILSGQTASSTGRTIYDPAITNTQIDSARARFDPNVSVSNDWERNNRPGYREDVGDIAGVDRNDYRFNAGLTQVKPHGGTASLGVTTTPSHTFIPQSPNILNPNTPSALELNYAHPFLQGAGVEVNLAPIVIARLDTERSYFQLKDSVQEMVRSVIAGYWGLVLARTQLWANEQQVKQAEYAYERLSSELSAGRADIGDTAQAEVSLASFRANLISAQGELLNREAAFRNVLGLPPVDSAHFVPSTPPQAGRAELDWDSMIAIAEQNRPDVIELKLILEADRQRRIQAANRTLPTLDGNALYRWNGLQGRVDGNDITTQFGQFADWQLGLSFAVPLGLRAERAGLRQIDLMLARDQANIRQQIHAVHHTIAQSVRNLELAYAQYEAYRKVREASRVNLERIFRLFNVGGLPTENVTYLQVLQAITDWGNSVTREASALTDYNAELANLERQLGTILDSHAIQFYEEQFASIGPGGRLRPNACYPKSASPQCGENRYDNGQRPAEEAFDLDTIGFGSGRNKESSPNKSTLPNPKSGSDSNSNDTEPLPDFESQTSGELKEQRKRLEEELEANQESR